MEFLPIAPSTLRPRQQRSAEADWSFLDNPARFVFQLLAIPLFNLIATVALGGSLFSLMRNPSPLIGNLTLAFAVLLPIFLASCLGYGICTIRSYWHETARFVWMLPAAVFSYWFLNDATDYSAHIAIRDFFGPEPLFILITLPTASCCAYSLAAFLAHRHHAKLTS